MAGPSFYKTNRRGDISMKRCIVLAMAALVLLPSPTAQAVGECDDGAVAGDQAEPPPPQGEPGADTAGPIPIPTLGGMQWWSDELCFHNWRIQRHVLTEHCRLLDERDRRYAFGSFLSCLQRLEAIQEDHQIPPMRGKVVLVLHGLFRTRSSMAVLADYLGANGGYEAICVGYPSTQAPIGDHARALASIIHHLLDDGRLGGVERIDFVAHSLGNLVIRHCLADMFRDAGEAGLDPRIGRVVMLAPPNHRPQTVDWWAENRLLGRGFRWLTPDVHDELTAGWADLEPRLRMPPCEFGILAGGRGDDEGWSDSLAGDDDGTVTTEETRLAGASDFAVVPVRHGSLMFDPTVLEYTLRFLEQGHFKSADERQEIHQP
jgi:hypothetical protein